jgi:hypothetical protein
MNQRHFSCGAVKNNSVHPAAGRSGFITVKEIAAAAEISQDTLERKPALQPVRKAIAESLDPICERPRRCDRAKLRTRLSLYGHQHLAEKI